MGIRSWRQRELGRDQEIEEAEGDPQEPAWRVPDGSGSSPHPRGTDAESFTTPADTLSCRRQTNPENTPNLALSLTVPTLNPLTDIIEKHAVIAEILAPLGLSARAPPRSPARAFDRLQMA